MTYINGVCQSIFIITAFKQRKGPQIILYSFGHFGDTPCIHDCIIIKLLWCHVVRCGTLVVGAHTYFLSFFGAHLLLRLLLHRPCDGGGSGSPYVAKIQLGILSPPCSMGLCIIRQQKLFIFFWVWDSCLKLGQLCLFVSFFLLWIWPPPPYLHFSQQVLLVGVYVHIYM